MAGAFPGMRELRMRFRSVKDAIARPLHRFGYRVAGLPKGTGRAVFNGFGTILRSGYFLPGSHVRKTLQSFCHAADCPDAWPIYSRMVDNLETVALKYAHLGRYGRDELLSQTTVDPNVEAQIRDLRGGRQGVIILVPHCIGAVLSSARLSTLCPTMLLVREPKDPDRCALMLDYVRKLGPEFILARNTPPATVMRNIVRALKENKVVVGTTDLVQRGPDTIEARAFGQTVHSPGWPAKISGRLGAPILPSYIHMEGERIHLMADKGYLEPDPVRCTQRWLSCFERWFREFPSDWVFMFDKRWSRILASAAAKSVGSEKNVLQQTCN